jgi:hypothetical protein
LRFFLRISADFRRVCAAPLSVGQAVALATWASILPKYRITVRARLGMCCIPDLIMTILILVAAFIGAPFVIDHVPILAEQARWLKVLLCYVFSGLVFMAVILIWAGALRFISMVFHRKNR